MNIGPVKSFEGSILKSSNIYAFDISFWNIGK